MIKIGIYKIENLINGNCYIGQSVNIYKRWQNEKEVAFNPQNEAYNYPLSCAFRKYGIENFSFNILEECQREELNEKEIYWIARYDSYNNGYNQTPGGDTVLHMCKLTPQKALEIIEILSKDVEGVVSRRQLAKDYGVSADTIQAINAGRQWYNDNYSYPLHVSKYDTRAKKEWKCADCGKSISYGAIRCNKCNNLYRTQCRIKPNSKSLTKKETKIELLPTTKEELNQLLLDNNGNFTKVGKLFNISDNGLRKWCKKLDLPTHSSDYKIKKEEKSKDPNYLRSVRCVEENLIFSCASEAARWLVEQGKSKSFNSSKNHIPKVCQGERKTHAKYHWEYV